MGMLVFRKLADRSVGERVRRYHPVTGQAYLSDPASHDPEVHSPWPLAGVRIDDPPQQTTVSARKVAEGVAQGWVELVDVQLVHAPGGPAEDQWRVTHTFQQASHIIFHTVDGDVRYRVVGQPGKHEDPAQPSGFRVDWFYALERVDA
jgi:hypothetical protein